MDENKINDEKPYIKEKIVKKKNSPAKIIGRILLWALSGVVFGLCAALAFYFIKPHFEETKEEETTQAIIELPVYTQGAETTPPETEPEPTTQEDTESSTEGARETFFSDEQEAWLKRYMEAMAAGRKMEMGDIRAVNTILENVAKAAKGSLVELTGYKSENAVWKTQGIVFFDAEENNEILILSDITAATEADRIMTVFPSGLPEAEAEIKGCDHVYGICVLAVSTAGLNEGQKKNIKVTTFGNNYSLGLTNTIILIGSPYLSYDSAAVGRITYIKPDCQAPDSSFKLFATDISVPENSKGFAIDLSGQLVGVFNTNIGLVTNTGAPAGYAAVIGTGAINDTLSCMSNGKTASLLGIYGIAVNDELKEAGMPAGVYVSKVMESGPAFNAGISEGDIITNISQAEVTDITHISHALTGTHLPEETVKVTMYRQSRGEYQKMTVSVTLGSR